MDKLLNSLFKHFNVTKANFFFLIGLLFLGLSCENVTNSRINLPVSKGKINETTVIVDNFLWNGEVGDSLRVKLAHPIDGLLSEEPTLEIKQFSPKIFNDDIKQSRNLLIIKQDTETEFIHVENEFAKPQNVFYLKGQTIQDILELISIHGETIENSIRFYEILNLHKDIYNASLSDKRIQEQFGISLLIPHQYKYTIVNPDFLWLKRDLSTGSSSILIFQVPINQLENENDFIANFINVRDLITQKYIKGVNKNSYMESDKSYAPYFKKVILNEEVTAFEFRGTWDLKNDFMEGPYLSYLFKDAKNNRYVFLDGFVYNPSYAKRDLMFELEAIMKSIYFIE